MKRTTIILSTMLPVLSLLAAPGIAQTGPDSQNISAQAYLSFDKLTPDARFQVAIVLQVTEPWHVNANPASVEGFIPTTVTLSATPSVVIDRIVYPKGLRTTVSWADQPVDLYTGRVVILVEAHIPPDAATGPVSVEANLRYQACDDRVCFAPVTIPVKIATEIVPATQTPQPVHPEIFKSAEIAPRPTTPPKQTEDSIAVWLKEKGLLPTLFIVFALGLGLNLTPCVFPMIAITVSYFGGRTEQKLGAAFLRALTYFLGIVITYTILGLVAGLSGSLFGALLQQPIVLIAIGALLVAMALSMFGLYELQPPQFLMQRATGLSSKAGFIGLFFLGAVVGIIAAPCVAPIQVSLLAFVAQTGNPWLGGVLFFVLSIGLGVPYVILGTFPGLLSRLPKSGMWMVRVKYVFGVALIAVALWITNPLWWHPSPMAQGDGIAWQPYSSQALRQAATDKRPVLIDFYADWCIPCKEMDKKTYPDPQVIEKSRQFLMLKADLTHTGSPEVDQLAKAYEIRGVPTAVFIGADGRELSELRKIGFVSIQELLDAMGKTFSASPVSTNSAATSSTSDIPPQLLRPF